MTPMMVRKSYFWIVVYNICWDNISKIRPNAIMLSHHRCCIWRWRRRRNHSGSVARSVLDCYQFIFWRKRSGSSTVGFLWRVYSNVCAANCWRLPGNRPASWVASHDFRYRNTSKQSFDKRRLPIKTTKIISINLHVISMLVKIK